MTEQLGRLMQFRAFSLKGKQTKQQWRTLLYGVATAIDMESADQPAVWTYPTKDGAGGNGHTMCLPITTSFICLDTWPDHDGAYLVVCSCRKFDPRALREFLHKYGLVVNDERDHHMEIK